MGAQRGVQSIPLWSKHSMHRGYAGILYEAASARASKSDMYPLPDSAYKATSTPYVLGHVSQVWEIKLGCKKRVDWLVVLTLELIWDS